MILSASRRTDIPSFYSEWFMNRLKAGYAITKNPMNPSQVSRVILSSENVDCIVFWTKDPLPMMNRLTELDSMGYHYYFQFTITPYGNQIERNLRDKKDIMRTFRQLSDRLGKERVIWRYDPILINDELTAGYHIDHFTWLCNELKGYTDQCIISFVDLYSKVSKSAKAGIIGVIAEQEMHDLSRSLSEIGASCGIELRACCEKLDLSEDGVKPAACIDIDSIERICGHPIREKKDKSQRPSCECIQSVDIGVYNTCMNGCLYCYANHSEPSIRKNYLAHNPKSPILVGNLSPDLVVKDRRE